jgi:hypothetical protein
MGTAITGMGRNGGGSSEGIMCVPDYANMETINRITENNGTWIADRSGFVMVSAYRSGASGDVVFYINGSQIAQCGSASDIHFRQTLPIQKGDTVKISVISGTPQLIYCYFIPPTFIGIEFAPVVAENFKNYQCIPDYANMEATNRLPTKGSAWTVDRPGFVMLTVANTTAGTAGSWLYHTINGRNFGVYGMSAQAGAANDGFAHVYAVSPGDVVSVGSYNNVHTAQSCYFIPPKFAAVSAPVVAENFMNYLAVPDYTNQETINRISTNNGTWTADRAGFVDVDAYRAGGSGDIVYFINDIPVAQCGSSSDIHFRQTLSVAVGDVVKIQATSGTLSSIVCYFIPPKFSVVSAPVMQEGGDYSATEKPVIIREGGSFRQKRDLDGSPIFCKTIAGTVTAAAGSASPTTTALTGVKNLCKCDGWWAYNTGGDKRLITLSGNKVWEPDEYEWDVLLEASHEVKYISYSVQERNAAPFQLYVEYTKS